MAPTRKFEIRNPRSEIRNALCASIAGPTMDEALQALGMVGSRADLVELRFDLIRDYDLPRLLLACQVPAIATLRPTRQGGQYVGSESSRLDILRRAAELGAAYVDVELDAASRVESLAPARKIVSYHDFESFPERLANIVSALWDAGADVAKVAVAAEAVEQVGELLGILKHATRPTIALAMGTTGAAGRLLCLRYKQCFLTYVAPDRGRHTAPGQLTLAEVEQVYRAHAVGSRTRAVGYAGTVEERGVLRALNAALERQRLNAVCVPIGRADVPAALAALDALELDGVVLSEPLDADRFPEVALGPERRANVLVRRAGGVIGLWGATPDEQALLFTHR